MVGRKIVSVEGFNYSPALKAHAGEVWTYEHLDAMIHKPADFAPGTLMAFPGLPDAQQRADVIAFLRTKTDNPPPLPEVVAAKEAPTEGAKPAEGAAKGGEAAPGAEILPALAKADPKKGEANVALCKVCHSFDKGAPSPIGPNLYGVVGRKIASLEGFNYSPALKAKASEGDWTFEHLDLWLTNPQAFAPGTTMAFPGIPDLQTRADVIDFLRTKSDSPVPLPEAASAATPAPAPAAEEKPAEAPAAPAAEKPAEAPAAPTAEKPAEAPAAPAAEKPAEAPAAPAAEKPAEAPAAPATEEKPVEAPAPAEAAPAEAAAPAANGDFSEPSTARQPQPVVPGEEPAPASEEAPAAESGPGDFSEPSTARQPQPAYPDGEPQ